MRPPMDPMIPITGGLFILYVVFVFFKLNLLNFCLPRASMFRIKSFEDADDSMEVVSSHPELDRRNSPFLPKQITLLKLEAYPHKN